MSERIVIDCWDWHYKVGFDYKLAEKIKAAAQSLQNKPEQHLLLQQLEVFSSMISISALCDALEENPERSKELLAGIDGYRILCTPTSVADSLRIRIAQLPEKFDHVKKEISLLLDSAEKARFINYHAEIFEPVFGLELNNLLSKKTTQFLPRPKDESIAQENFVETVNLVLKNLLNSCYIDKILGEVSIPKFDLLVKEEFGFAEYWPAEISKSKKNSLIIFHNPDNRLIGTLQTTLAHEVLGHGTFYEVEMATAPSFFDHGAMCLIEGWATWCEWHASDTPQGMFYRSGRLHGLNRFYEKDVTKICAGISEDVTNLGYSWSAINSAMLYFFQYPGFSFSYTLGALWMEEKFRATNPESFFNSLKKRPWGDFFLLW